MRLAKPLTLALAAAAVLAIPHSADAGWGWGPWFKPDLRITYMGTSAVSPYHARFHVTNQGTTTSKACYIRATCYGPNTTTGVGWVPSMAPGSIHGIDTWIGQPMDANPGQMSVGWIDCYQGVAESNEGNNIRYYYAPPH